LQVLFNHNRHNGGLLTLRRVATDVLFIYTGI